MVVRNCGESPSSLQILESKVQTFSLDSQKNETHLTQIKRKYKINMWVCVFHSIWSLIHLGREERGKSNFWGKLKTNRDTRTISLSLFISFASCSNQLLHFVFFFFFTIRLNREIIFFNCYLLKLNLTVFYFFFQNEWTMKKRKENYAVFFRTIKINIWTCQTWHDPGRTMRFLIFHFYLSKNIYFVHFFFP